MLEGKRMVNHVRCKFNTTLDPEPAASTWLVTCDCEALPLIAPRTVTEENVSGLVLRRRLARGDLKRRCRRQFSRHSPGGGIKSAPCRARSVRGLQVRARWAGRGEG